jgi:hypothetical protein
MSGSIAVPATEARRRVSERAGVRSRFFLGASVAMFAIVLMGFARTLYLRPLFEVQPIPPYLYAHGVLLTGWYFWFIVQSSLVRWRRVDLHRRFGIVGVVLAMAVVGMSALTSLRFGPRLAARGADIDARLHFVSEIVWSNIGALACFSSFLTIAIVMRHRPQIHKRMLFLASVSTLPPALSRVFDWPIWGVGDNAVVPVFGCLVLFVCALGMHDARATRSVHPATLIGGVVLVGSFALSVFVLPGTELGQATIRALYDLMR